MKTSVHTKVCIQIFTAVLFTIIKNWKQTNIYQIEKQTVTHIGTVYINYYSAIKTNKVLIPAQPG